LKIGLWLPDSFVLDFPFWALIRLDCWVIITTNQMTKGQLQREIYSSPLNRLKRKM
jgi:hypothetical protein